MNPNAVLVTVVLFCAVAAGNRCWRTTAAVAGVAAIQLFLLAPWWIAGPQAVDDVRAGDGLVEMTSNLFRGKADMENLVDMIRDHEVDVVTLLELTPAGHAGLTAAGLEDELPHMVGVAREGTSGSAVFSRFPLREETLPAADLYFEAPVARVHAPAGDVVVLAAHSLPPLGVMAPVWRDELEALATLAADVPQATPLVMAGDFNASESHPGLRRLHDEGLRDAHREVGDGPLATWPSLGTPPILHIDHVLVRGLGVAHAGSASVAGSDHDAVWASLVLPGHVAAPVTARDRRAVGPSW